MGGGAGVRQCLILRHILVRSVAAQLVLSCNPFEGVVIATSQTRQIELAIVLFDIHKNMKLRWPNCCIISNTPFRPCEMVQTLFSAS